MAGAAKTGKETGGGPARLLHGLGEALPCAFAVLHRDGTPPTVSAAARRLLDRHRLDPRLLTDPDGPAAPGIAAALAGRPLHGHLLSSSRGTATLVADYLPVPGGAIVHLEAHPLAESLPFFQHSLDLLCVADHGGRLVRLSPSWGDALGWDVHDMVGQPFLDLVHPDDRARTRRAAGQLAEHREVVRFENRYRCRDGSYRWLQWNAVSPPGGPIYAVARDVTDQRNATVQLHAAYEVLQDAEQRRLQIFRHVVHDIATPLSAMGLQLALLETGCGPADVERLRRVHEHLQRLLQDLRDLSLMESERLRLRREATPAHDLLGPTLDALRRAAEARGIELGVRVDDVVLDVDPLRFNQIVYNLVTNALKFTPPGGRVHVSAVHARNAALLTVEDTGRGLDEGEARRLFQPFVQVHEASVAERGSGLGLFICKQLTEAHGGRIWVESPGRGGGCRFHVELPTAAPPVQTV